MSVALGGLMSGRYRLTESLPFRNGRGLTTYSDAVMRKEVAIVGVPRAKCASVSRTYQDRYFLPQVPARPPSYLMYWPDQAILTPDVPQLSSGM